MRERFEGKTVLVTGGTRGIGLATALAFASHGARCTITHRWGSEDEDEIRDRFTAIGATEPAIFEADVANGEDTDALLGSIADRDGPVDVFVSNAAFAPAVSSLDDYVKRDFLRAIEYSAWPLAEYPKRIKAVMGRYPAYIVGMSSPGHERFTRAYDAVAVSKAVLETMCRYLAHRLGPEGSRVNIVRAGFVDTESLKTIIGSDVLEQLRQKAPESIIPAQEVANAVLALCSGLLDGVNGHVLAVDRGTVFADSILKHFEQGLGN